MLRCYAGTQLPVAGKRDYRRHNQLSVPTIFASRSQRFKPVLKSVGLFKLAGKYCRFNPREAVVFPAVIFPRKCYA